VSTSKTRILLKEGGGGERRRERGRGTRKTGTRPNLEHFEIKHRKTFIPFKIFKEDSVFLIFYVKILIVL
jgi:hypothetical protein